MNVPSSSWWSKCWPWLTAYPFTALGAVLLVAVAITFCRRQDSEWEQVYVRAAGHLWKGEDMYRMQNGYLYPPFMALTALPFLAIPFPVSRFVWFLVNAICLLALLRWGWRVAGGGRLEGVQSSGTRERLAALLGCLCGISYIENCLAHQQTDIVIGAMLAGGCLLLWRGRPMLAATSLGLAAACKCTALLWAPYLLWRGRPLAALWLLVVVAGVNLLPDQVHPAPGGRSWCQEYAARFLEPLTASDHYIGTWGTDPVYNQSFTGLAQRWCTTAWTWTTNDCTIETRPPLLRPETLRIWVYGVELSLLGAVLWICGRPFQKLLDTEEGTLQALECGMILLLMLLLSPMSSKAHFGTLVVPGYCLARAALSSRSHALKALLAGSVLLGLLCNKDPLGERLYTLSLWYGVVTWQTLLLLVGCLFVYQKQRVRAREMLPCSAPADALSNQAA